MRHGPPAPTCCRLLMGVIFFYPILFHLQAAPNSATWAWFGPSRVDCQQTSSCLHRVIEKLRSSKSSAIQWSHRSNPINDSAFRSCTRDPPINRPVVHSLHTYVHTYIYICTCRFTMWKVGGSLDPEAVIAGTFNALPLEITQWSNPITKEFIYIFQIQSPMVLSTMYDRLNGKIK